MYDKNNLPDEAAAMPRVSPLIAPEVGDDIKEFLRVSLELITALDTRDPERIRGMAAFQAVTEAEIRASWDLLPPNTRMHLRRARLFTRIKQLGFELVTGGVLAPRDRELAVLRTVYLCNAPHPFGEHVMVARKLGFTAEDIERVTRGSEAEGWSPLERAIVRAAEEMREISNITDETWAMLAEHLNEEQLIELTVVIGQYQATACVHNALGMQLIAGNQGLNAR